MICLGGRAWPFEIPDDEADDGQDRHQKRPQNLCSRRLIRHPDAKNCPDPQAKNYETQYVTHVPSRHVTGACAPFYRRRMQTVDAEFIPDFF